MNKASLKKLPYLIMEVEYFENDLKAIEKNGYLAGIPFCVELLSKDYVEELKKNLLEQKDRRTDEINILKKYIVSIKNVKTQRIIILKYLNRFTARKIGIIMGYDSSGVLGRIRRELRRNNDVK